MSSYATGTTVSIERSKGESILARYGADQFLSGWKNGMAVIGFRMKNRMIRFTLPIPSPEDFKKYKTKRKYGYSERSRSDGAAIVAWEKENRRRWRALALVLKAKLEAVQSGITTFETEFMPHTVLPNGLTVAEWAGPQIATAYESGQMPPLLPWAGDGDKK